MSSIREHHGKYQARYYDPAGKLRSKSFARKTDARAFLAAMETDKRRGQWIDSERSKITVEQWSATWLPSKADLRPTSKARLEGIVRTHVLPEFGGLPLAALSNGQVRSWVAGMLADGLSPATVRKAANALAQMTKAAVADRRLSFDPCQNVPLPAEHCNEQRFLSAGEVGMLADVIESRYRVLVLVAAYGGLRWGELAGLRRRRVDLLRGTITVAETLVEVAGDLSFGQPKTQKSRRVVPLPRRVVRELDAHLEAFTAADADALVFTTATGAPLHRSNFRRSYWTPAVRAAGLEPLKMHELRHSFVALWVNAGANPKEVSVRAGHSSVAFTLDRYGHLYDQAEDTMDKLDALLGDPDSEAVSVSNVAQIWPKRGPRAGG